MYYDVKDDAKWEHWTEHCTVCWGRTHLSRWMVGGKDSWTPLPHLVLPANFLFLFMMTMVMLGMMTMMMLMTLVIQSRGQEACGGSQCWGLCKQFHLLRMSIKMIIQISGMILSWSSPHCPCLGSMSSSVTSFSFQNQAPHHHCDEQAEVTCSLLPGCDRGL